MKESGAIGLALSFIGIGLLLLTFYIAYETFSTFSIIQVGGLEETLRTLFLAAVKALFLGIMAWVGSIFLVRGVEYMKVDRGIGMVTFKVEKGVGVAKIEEKEGK